MKYALKKSSEHRELALQHIHSLFEQAERCFPQHKGLAHRYVQLARRMAMKYKVPLPLQFKRLVCKHCHHYLQQGVNCRVRLTKQKVVYYCMDCKHYMRFPYHPKKVKISVKLSLKA